MKPQIPVSAPKGNERDPSLLTVAQAQTQIQHLLVPIQDTVHVGIRESLGRVLAADITAPINVPSYINSAMDGYAVRSADLPTQHTTNFALIGTSWAGRPFAGTVGATQCVRIMTGAKVPAGADTVIMQEQVQVHDQQVRIGAGHQAGQNVRHPGDDIRQGSILLTRGKKLGPAELGLLASQGIAQISVYRRVRVAFFSTGDELRPVGAPLHDGQIYDSNRYTLSGMLTQAGVELIDLGVIADQLDAIEHAMHAAAAQAEVIITTGGVSVGDADFVKTVLEKLGQVNFWRIAMKPGKPLAIGKVGQAAFFGLPGNPVSVMATFYEFVLPALRSLGGELPRTPLLFHAITKSRLKKSPGRTDFQRGILTAENGKLYVDASGMQASHILSGMSRANCFIVLPQDCGNIDAGEEVAVQPFADFV
jgi:molybdopterin molybdotransferase